MQGAGPVSLQQGQLGHTPGHGGALLPLGGPVERGQKFAVGIESARIGVAVEEFRVFG